MGERLVCDVETWSTVASVGSSGGGEGVILGLLEWIFVNNSLENARRSIRSVGMDSNAHRNLHSLAQRTLSGCTCLGAGS